MRTFGLYGIAAGYAFVAAAPAQAQDLGVETGRAIATALFGVADGHSCITGHNPFAKGTTTRILAMSELSLKEYLRLSGGGPANVRPAYSTKKVVLSWSLDGQAGDIGAVDDPVARSLGTAPDSFAGRVINENFLIAGDKFSTMGLWRVVSAEDPSRVLGRYRARFWRHNTLDGQSWDLMSLEVTTGAALPAPVVQYCSVPGDVEQYAIDQQKRATEKARRKAEKAR